MPLTLTPQEKKVLGFVAVMVLLGLIMLGLKAGFGLGARPDSAQTPVAGQSTP